MLCDLLLMKVNYDCHLLFVLVIIRVNGRTKAATIAVMINAAMIPLQHVEEQKPPLTLLDDEIHL